MILMVMEDMRPVKESSPTVECSEAMRSQFLQTVQRKELELVHLLESCNMFPITSTEVFTE